jgi:hypothetical protein
MSRRLPSPALVVALVALFVALSGTAVAAGVVPVARFAANAGKLQGKSAAQVARIAGPANTLSGKTADEIAAMPGPATTLEGKSLAEVAAMPGPATTLEGKSLAEVAAMPGPASTAGGLVSVATQPFSIAGDGQGNFSASCPAGTHVISGGYSYSGNPLILSVDDRPTSDTTWSIYLVNMNASVGASGSIYAVCLK